MDYVFFNSQGEADGRGKIMSCSEFEQIRHATEIVQKVYRLEELYYMHLETLSAFNACVHRRADEMRYRNFDTCDDYLFRVGINLSLSNFFTVFWMYHDYLSLKKANPFCVNPSTCQSPAINQCKFFRHYIQHVGNLSLTLKHEYQDCALEESLSSARVCADVHDIQDHLPLVHRSTQNLFPALSVKNAEIDMYEVLSLAHDALMELHLQARQSKICSTEYEESLGHLDRARADLIRQGLVFYRQVSAAEPNPVRTLYLYDRQIEMVSWFRTHHPCKDKISNRYLTTAPQLSVARMANADQDVQGFRDAGGVVAKIKDVEVRNSKYMMQTASINATGCRRTS